MPSPRPFQPDDLPAIQELWVAAWQAVLPGEDFAARRAWLADHLAAAHAAGAATLCLGPAAAPAGFLTWFAASGLVEQLAVHPRHAGRGLGAALLAAVRTARPEGLHLLVNQENPHAIGFYQSQGFRITERTTNPGGTRLVLRMVWP